MKIKSQNRTASFDFRKNEIKTQANVIGFQKQFDLFLIRREKQWVNVLPRSTTVKQLILLKSMMNGD